MTSRLASRAVLFAVLAGALIAAAVPASQAQQGAAPASPAGAGTEAPRDPVLAIVNGEVIRLSDMEAVRQYLPPQAQGLPVDVLYPALIEGMIGSKLAAQAARQKQLQDVASHRQQMARLEDQLLERAFLAGEIADRSTEAALRKQYEEHVAQMGAQEEVHARHILVETEDQAKDVIAELGKGGDFADLAKARSTGPSGPRGGDLGFFAKDQMVGPFAEAAFAMQPGETSTVPVQTEFGWHVIKVEERREGQPPTFSEVEDEVRNALQRTLALQVLEELRAKATIEKFGLEGRPAER